MNKRVVSWLNLHEWIPQRDVRRLIYRKLRCHERFVVEHAHGLTPQLADRKTEFVVYTAAHGSLSLLQWSRGLFEWTSYTTSCVAAVCIRAGHIHILQWLVDSCGYRWMQPDTELALRAGGIDVLRWAKILRLSKRYKQDE